MNGSKNILVCPLDWGLGHATRCIPIIRILLNRGCNVIIGADGKPLRLLQQEFPELKYIRFRGYEIDYPENGSMLLKIIVQLPRLLDRIFKEHFILMNQISEYNIHGVISDNRIGLWSRRIPSVYMTHQVRIMVPRSAAMLGSILHWLHRQLIRRYTFCWIPDYEAEPNLAGDLSHTSNLPCNCRYIGPLSRFNRLKNTPTKYELLALLSGPEPQRTILENKIQQQVKALDLKTLIVRGIPAKSLEKSTDGDTESVNHLPADELNHAIAASRIIVARAGYSTIMDLVRLGRKAILIPTPGQTEQEYLARELKRRGMFYSETQEHFDLKRALNESETHSNIPSELPGKSGLEAAVDEFLAEL